MTCPLPAAVWDDVLFPAMLPVYIVHVVLFPGYNTHCSRIMNQHRLFFLRSFRSLSSPNKTAQQDRDEWYQVRGWSLMNCISCYCQSYFMHFSWLQAILNGCYSRRESTVGLRRGTTTGTILCCGVHFMILYDYT